MHFRKPADGFGEQVLVCQLPRDNNRLPHLLPCLCAASLAEDCIPQFQERLGGTFPVAYLAGDCQALFVMISCLHITTHKKAEHPRGQKRPAPSKVTDLRPWSGECLHRDSMPQCNHAGMLPVFA